MENITLMFHNATLTPSKKKTKCLRFFHKGCLIESHIVCYVKLSYRIIRADFNCVNVEYFFPVLSLLELASILLNILT